MTDTQSQAAVPPLSPRTLAGLRKVGILASLDDARLECLTGTTERHLAAGEILIRQGEAGRHFWMLLEGSLNMLVTDSDGREQKMYTMPAGNAFGEVPLLANMPSSITVQAGEDSELLELSEEQFWVLMTVCPEVRKAVLSNMAVRMAKMQSTSFQQEKMAALGTLAAGLMHELNNPGSAARRASSQLRENLMRMHRLTARFARSKMEEPQKQCMYDLQEYALSAKPWHALNSLEQADAEDTLSEWLEQADVADAWKLAPTFVSIGIDLQMLACARQSFSGETFSDALNWLEALVSSMQLVGTIEESIGRVTDLVQAVKSYAYEGRGQKQSINLNQSIQATLIILGHKLREKQIVLEKQLAADLPPLETGCHGLNQIWTNLLDNSIDAAPQHGRISVKTWAEKIFVEPARDGAPQERTVLCVLITDNGAGIPMECQEAIFDPFFTTKPVGVGTGLGLGIVHRIVEQCGGTIRFSSRPGETEFAVRLPATSAS